ncbi:hypothetical protein M408DRAFT_329681 [Serendipita vermifera MAFF 305830]|uniref:Uncharacterized protein n=1 Tax=Serendipita vermifera MAFF 305830 TaxID=933852 RepID=A0A0C3B996_SERVB|nr:hypothetical protein M408DRAFT_329681 [Serendipita vermifera MAFF 305830]
MTSLVHFAARLVRKNETKLDSDYSGSGQSTPFQFFNRRPTMDELLSYFFLLQVLVE